MARALIIGAKGSESSELVRTTNVNQNSKTKLDTIVPKKASKETEADSAKEDISCLLTRRALVATKLVAADSSNQAIVTSDGTKILPDASIEDALKEDYDAVVLPGGMGARDEYISKPIVGQILKKQEDAGKLVCAICAAPTALIHYGIGQSKRITCYPALGSAFEGKNYKFVKDEHVVVDGNLVTSQGPFTTFAFGLKIAELLTNKKTADGIKDAMLVKC